MKIEIPGGHITIDDNSDEAKKILSGYAYSIVEGQLVVSNNKTGLDIASLLIKIKAGTLSAPEVHSILAYLLEKELK